MRSFDRIDRIRSEMQRYVSDALRHSVKGYDLSEVTVTGVDVSRDCKYATVYYTVMEGGRDRKETAGILSKVRTVVQSAAGRRLGIRVVPQLRFAYDDAMERGLELGELFSQIEEERKDGSKDNEEN